jgi:YfiH family protein
MPFAENKTGGLVYMTSSALSTAHAFTTRYGGVSDGIYKTLNLGQNMGDDPLKVRMNYDILGAALGFSPERLALSRQVHKTDIRCATKDNTYPPFGDIPYEADGLITGEKDLPLIVFTADCVPILLFDPVGCAIGAVHAGWRGTTQDIAGKAVLEMTRCFGSRPEDIRVAVGPSISACCYETGRDVADAVGALGSGAGKYAVPHDGKFMVDLKGLNVWLLERAGLLAENVDISPECTSCRSDKYWSHRKTHGRRGSQASVIMLKGTMN